MIPPFNSVDPNGLSGPIEYRATPFFKRFTIFVIVVHFLVKIACVCFVLSHSELRSRGTGFCVFFALFYFSSIFNVWLLKTMYYRPYETMMRFDCKNFVVTPFPYLYVIDQFCIMFSPIILKHYEYTLPGCIAIGNIVFFLNWAAFLIVKYANTRDYYPLENDEKYSLINWTEENELKNICSLSIKESGAFKIVLMNTGGNFLDKTLAVQRTVFVRRAFLKRFIEPEKETVCFNVMLRISPGATATLIPITHSLNGAKEINLRSFGYHLGERVETRVYEKDNPASCVKRIENYQLIEQAA